MKNKTYQIAFVIVMALGCLNSPANAQYHHYSSGRPEVELNLDVIDTLGYSATPTPSAAPVATAPAPKLAPQPVMPPTTAPLPIATVPSVTEPVTPANSTPDIVPVALPESLAPPSAPEPITSHRILKPKNIRATDVAISNHAPAPLPAVKTLPPADAVAPLPPLPVSEPHAVTATPPILASDTYTASPIVQKLLRKDDAPTYPPAKSLDTRALRAEDAVVTKPLRKILPTQPTPLKKPPEKKLDGVKTSAHVQEKIVEKETTKEKPPASPVIPDPEKPSLPITAASPSENTDISEPLTADETSASAPSPVLTDMTLDFSEADNSLTEKHSHQMQDVITRLKDNDMLRLQIRAYATGDNGNKANARRMALSRALSIRSFLMDNGIKPSRVDVRALGNDVDHGATDRADLIFMH